MLKIAIQTIPHEQQRYNTCGDWFDGQFKWQMITVSDMGNKDMEFLVGLHEYIENHLARKRGITPAMADEFDKNFKGEGEPGDSPDCPYGPDHQSATRIEKVAAEILGIDWSDYDDAVSKL